MRRERPSYKRKAIAGVVSAVLFFAMLFTVGASYFLFVNYQNQSYIQSLVPRVNSLDSQGSETAVVTAVLLSSNNHVGFYLNNTGGMNINMTAFMLYASSTGQPLICVGKGLPSSVCSSQSTTFTICTNASCSSTLSPSQSFVVDNVGNGTRVVDTGYTYADTTVTLKILTSNGVTFSQTYPDTTSNNPVASALNAGAIGDLYLTFSDYKSWTITTSGCNTTIVDFSGYCLGTASSAFAIPANNDCFPADTRLQCVVFSVRVTDLNQQHDSIQLSQISLFYQLYQAGNNGKAGYYPWYLISNSSTSLYNHFHVMNLTYNQPQTLIFGSVQCLAAYSGPNLSQCNGSPPITLSEGNWFNGPGQASGQVGVSFINPNGWELSSISPTSDLHYSTMNYAQNLAFLSTLYT